jgi:hypothetical protein
MVATKDIRARIYLKYSFVIGTDRGFRVFYNFGTIKHILNCRSNQSIFHMELLW